MTIQEAIEFLGALQKDLVLQGMPGFAKAVGLAIEALKYFKNDRLYCQKIAQQLLPGETDE